MFFACMVIGRNGARPISGLRSPDSSLQVLGVSLVVLTVVFPAVHAMLSPEILHHRDHGCTEECMSGPAPCAYLAMCMRIIGIQLQDRRRLNAAMTTPVFGAENYQILETIGDAALNLMHKLVEFRRIADLPEDDGARMRGPETITNFADINGNNQRLRQLMDGLVHAGGAARLVDLIRVRRPGDVEQPLGVGERSGSGSDSDSDRDGAASAASPACTEGVAHAAGGRLGRPRFVPDKVKADVLEAIIGVVFLELGLDATADWYQRQFGGAWKTTDVRWEDGTCASENYSGLLQQLMQSERREKPAYRELAVREVPGTMGRVRRVYSAEVVAQVDGREVRGTGSGFSKRVAKQEAAKVALAACGRLPPSAASRRDAPASPPAFPAPSEPQSAAAPAVAGRVRSPARAHPATTPQPVSEPCMSYARALALGHGSVRSRRTPSTSPERVCPLSERKRPIPVPIEAAALGARGCRSAPGRRFGWAKA